MSYRINNFWLKEVEEDTKWHILCTVHLIEHEDLHFPKIAKIFTRTLKTLPVEIDEELRAMQYEFDSFPVALEMVDELVEKYGGHLFYKQYGATKSITNTENNRFRLMVHYASRTTYNSNNRV